MRSLRGKQDVELNSFARFWPVCTRVAIAPRALAVPLDGADPLEQQAFVESMVHDLEQDSVVAGITMDADRSMRILKACFANQPSSKLHLAFSVIRQLAAGRFMSSATHVVQIPAGSLYIKMSLAESTERQHTQNQGEVAELLRLIQITNRGKCDLTRRALPDISFSS